MRDLRLGYGDEFPALTVGGNAYQRPVSTQNIGDGYFVALDVFPSEDAQRVIDELKASLTPKKQKAKEVNPDDAESAGSSL